MDPLDCLLHPHHLPLPPRSSGEQSRIWPPVLDRFPEPWHWRLWMTLVCISLFFIPAIIIASCYAVIVITIWRKGQTMQAPKVTQSLLPRVPLTEARRRKIALE